MPRCPLCLHESPEGSIHCQYCGRHRFGTGALSESEHDQPTIPASKVPPRFGAPGQSPGTSTLPSIPGLGDSADIPTPVLSRLNVIRGAKIGVEFPLLEGPNLLGRSSDKPADIDLTPLEPAEQVWSSRQHALITVTGSTLLIQDLGSLNGTYVNRGKLTPQKKYQLQNGDIIQIGAVQFRVIIG